MLPAWIHSVCVCVWRGRDSELSKLILGRDKSKRKKTSAWPVWGVLEGFCAEVKFHLKPEGGGVGKSDSSR